MPPPKFSLPLPYRIFFLLIEPFSALVGAYYAHFHQPTYLSLTHLASSPPATQPLPLSTSIPLSQLANLYLLFAINEALVLRSTSDLTVWRTLLFGLLVADGGHLWSVSGKGWGVYYDVLSWNKMDWGNVGFVYVGAAMRICFLMSVGMGGSGKKVVTEKELKK